MIRIKRYVRVKNLDEAYKIMQESSNYILLGGFTFSRLSDRTVDVAIDLQDSGIKFIREDDEWIEVGGATPFGDIIRSDIFKRFLNGAFEDKVLKKLWSVQLRTIATVGGTIFPKLGFSDFITGLLALNVWVKLNKNGEMKLEEFLKTRIICTDYHRWYIKKEPRKYAFQFLRNSEYDFSVLNASASKLENGKDFRVVVGARPGVASLAVNAMDLLNKADNINEQVIEKAAKMASEELTFGSDFRGSKEYRKDMCIVLVKRVLREVVANGN